MKRKSLEFIDDPHAYDEIDSFDDYMNVIFHKNGNSEVTVRKNGKITFSGCLKDFAKLQA